MPNITSTQVNKPAIQKLREVRRLVGFHRTLEVISQRLIRQDAALIDQKPLVVAGMVRKVVAQIAIVVIDQIFMSKNKGRES